MRLEGPVMKKLEVLGMRCAKCQKLQESTEAAARELGLECEIEKVTDLDRIVELGIFLTPALAVDGEVKVSGRVPTPAELKAILS
jgi:small redox-active disulfide protein 2